MSLYKTQQGFGIDFRDEFGRRVRKFVGSQEAARALLAQAQDRAALGRRAFRNLARQPITITQAGEIFLSQLHASPITKDRLKQTYARLARFLGDVEATNIGPAQLEDYQAASRQEVSQNTWSTEAYAIRKLFAWLFTDNFTALNPAISLDAHTVPSTIARVITRHEEAKILDAATPKIQLRILLALDAGLRRGECASLRCNQIQWTNPPSLFVRASKTRHTRQVPMTARLLEMIHDVAAAKAHDATLLDVAGRELKRPGDFMRALKSRCGIQFRFHDLRHTFATRLAFVEKDVFVVAALLGHTIRLTTGQYVHPSPQQLDDAIRKLEAHFILQSELPLQEHQHGQ